MRGLTTNTMVLGFATLAGRAGLGMLTGLGSGLGMGIGYGYGVRLGYNMFKPAKNQKVNALHTSLNPIEGSIGAGMLTAEEVVGRQSQEPTFSLKDVAQGKPEVEQPQQKKYYDNPNGLYYTKDMIYRTGAKHGMTKRESWRAYAKGKYPFVSSYEKSRPRSPKYKPHG